MTFGFRGTKVHPLGPGSYFDFPSNRLAFPPNIWVCLMYELRFILPVGQGSNRANFLGTRLQVLSEVLGI